MLQILVAISQKFWCSQKKHEAMQKLFMKRRKKRKREKSVEKMDKCLRYIKQWVLRCPPKKEEMNKIAHVFLQSCFQVSKERYVFKEQSSIRLATINIHHIHPHTHAHLDLIVWLISRWIWGLTLQHMYCKYALSCFLPTYKLHISLNYRKRKA